MSPPTDPDDTAPTEFGAAETARRGQDEEPPTLPGADPWALQQLLERVEALQGRVHRMDNQLESTATGLDDLRSRVNQDGAHPAAVQRSGDTASETSADPAGASSNDADADAAASSDAATEVEPFDIRRLVAWVGNNVASVVERKIAQTQAPYWCPQWWRHPEAIVRFEAVRRCWLEACISPGSALVTYLEHLDHELEQMMSQTGTFSHCGNRSHTESRLDRRVLGQDEPPEGFFQSYETSAALSDASGTTSRTATGHPDGGVGDAEAAAAQSVLPPLPLPSAPGAGGVGTRPTPYPRADGRGELKGGLGPRQTRPAYGWPDISRGRGH